MKSYIYKQMITGIVRSIRMRKSRGDQSHEIVSYLVELMKKINNPRLRLFILLLVWMETQGAKEAV